MIASGLFSVAVYSSASAAIVGGHCGAPASTSRSWRTRPFRARRFSWSLSSLMFFSRLVSFSSSFSSPSLLLTCVSVLRRPPACLPACRPACLRRYLILFSLPVSSRHIPSFSFLFLSVLVLIRDWSTESARSASAFVGRLFLLLFYYSQA